MTELLEEYRRRYDACLVAIAQNLEEHVGNHLKGTPLIDRISARAKDPERFEVKAFKEDDEGNRVYGAPLEEIQDQVGVRVMFYLDMVEVVSEILERYLTLIESRTLVPESD